MTRTGDPATVRVRVSPRDVRATAIQVARYFGGPRFAPNPGQHENIENALTRAAGLIDPAFAYTIRRIETIEIDGRLRMAGGMRIPAPVGRLDARPRYLAVCIGTLGDRLERACSMLARQNKIHDAALLDAVGISLTDTLADRAHDRLRARAAGMGLFAGCRFGPGLGDVPMTTQTIVFQMLDAGSIGVKLNDSRMMNPVKSISFMVVFGEQPAETGAAGKCSHCGLKNCRFRVAD